MKSEVLEAEVVKPESVSQILARVSVGEEEKGQSPSVEACETAQLEK